MKEITDFEEKQHIIQKIFVDIFCINKSIAGLIRINWNRGDIFDNIRANYIQSANLPQGAIELILNAKYYQYNETTQLIDFGNDTPIPLEKCKEEIIVKTFTKRFKCQDLNSKVMLQYFKTWDDAKKLEVAQNLNTTVAEINNYLDYPNLLLAGSSNSENIE